IRRRLDRRRLLLERQIGRERRRDRDQHRRDQEAPYAIAHGVSVQIFGKPKASAGLSTKISLRVFSSGTQSSTWSSSAISLGIGLKYCGCGQSEPHSSRFGACSTSFFTSGSVSENGKLSCLEMRGDSFTQQRPVSRHCSTNLKP